jgi:hypothetical protein
LNKYSHASKYVQDLITLYGPPRQLGFGSAVFYEEIEPDSDLEKIALGYYQYFLGDLWNRFGEEAWMSSWREVYSRNTEGKPDILAELNEITDSEAARFVPMLLLSNYSVDSNKVNKALCAAYNGPDVTNLKLYNIGDGEALSGLLMIGCRPNGETTLLIVLLD